MKRKAKIQAISFLASVNYPKIKEGKNKPSQATLDVFGWIVNNFLFVLISLAVVLIIIAAYRTHRETIRYNARREKLRQLEERAREDAEARDLEDFRRRDFMRQQRALMTDSLRFDILKRDGYRCRICGAAAGDGVKLHVDHIIPVSKGGETIPSNLQTLCERCNMGKRDKLE